MKEMDSLKNPREVRRTCEFVIPVISGDCYKYIFILVACHKKSVYVNIK